MRILVDENFIIKDSCFAYGGMGPTTLSAKKTANAMLGKKWSISLIEEFSSLVLEDMPLAASSPGGQIQFRKTLAQSFLLKFGLRFTHFLSEFSQQYKLNSRELSSLNEINRGLSFGKQDFEESKTLGVVGKAVKHVSADKQVTGEAIYVDDIPALKDELYAAILGSTVSHGRIVSVDVSQALLCSGVKGYVSAKDLDQNNPHANMIGPVFKDEELFATENVYFMGQMIGIILANSEYEARSAVKLCKVTYETFPAVFTIEDAIASKSFFPIERRLERGDFSAKKSNYVEGGLPLSAATKFVEGTARMSGQEHFYLETNVSLVIPGEDDEMEIISSTQNPTGEF